MNDQQQSLSDQEIMRFIWTSPRKVFKYINDANDDQYVKILLILSGISRAFDRAAIKNMGDDKPLWAIVFLCLILGGIFGWISYYIYAVLVTWTGRWLDGKADFDSILRIISYALIPSIFALLFIIPQIGIYGIEIFKSDGDITSKGWILNSLFYSSIFFEFVLGIWTIVLCVIGISELQKFSVGKSILNMILPVLIILAPILIIVLLLTSF